MSYNNLGNPDGIRQVLTQQEIAHHTRHEYAGTTEDTEPPVGYATTLAGKPLIL